MTTAGEGGPEGLLTPGPSEALFLPWGLAGNPGGLTGLLWLQGRCLL